MLNLNNPIPGACKDTGDSRTFWNSNGKYIVPYYGNELYSSHNTLKVIYDLCQLSKSFVAAEEGIMKYAFGKNFRVGKNPIEGLDDPEFDDTIEDRTEILSFYNVIKDLGLNFKMLMEQTKEMYRAKIRTGNHYLYIKEVTVMGETSYSFKVLHPKQTAYLFTKPNAKKRIIHCKVWDEELWKTNKPQIIRATVLNGEWNWSERTSNATGTRIRETVVHGLNKVDESDWYGRSNKVLAILNSMFVEYSNGDLQCKTSSSEVVSKFVWLFEQQANSRGGKNKGASGFQNQMNALRRLQTVKGGNDSNVMAGIEYPKNGTKPELEKLEINRDTDYLKETSEQAEKAIFGTLGWFRELTGNAQTSGGLGSNQLINLFLIAQDGTVADEQCYFQEFWNFVFSEIGRSNNIQTLEDNGLKFTDNITDFVQKLKDSALKETPINTNQ